MYLHTTLYMLNTIGFRLKLLECSLKINTPWAYISYITLGYSKQLIRFHLPWGTERGCYPEEG